MIYPEYLLLSLPAGFFWLWYVYRRCRFHPPPIALVALAFVCGMFSPALVLAVHDLVESRFPFLEAMQVGSLPQRLFYFVVMVGLIEETSKLVSVRATVYYARSFDDVVHGVVLSSAAALGFATVENARYVEWHGAEVLLGRVILSTFGHVLQSMIWGFAMGAQKITSIEDRARQAALSRGERAEPVHPAGGWGGLLVGLGLAALIHGIYDLLLVYDQMWLALLLLFVLWRVFLGQIEVATRESPHRPRISRRVRECPACGGLVRGEGTHCGSCGRALPPDGTDFCAACLKVVDAASTACPHCACVLI